ncbi:MAG: type II secretion system protein N [Gammaproteobacteria bacterium]|nr:hypothetical protein [Gammaproteobacteria bacterium]
MKLRWLIGLAAVAYVLFAIVTFPASIVLAQFRDQGVAAVGIEGTIWKGRVQLLQVHGVNVGRAEWDLDAPALLTLKLRANVRVTRPDGFLQSQLTLTRGSVRFTDLTASLPLAALGAIAPAGWQGTTNLRFAELVLENGWPTVASGMVEILNLEHVAQRSPLTGSYKLTFPETNVDSTHGALRGVLTELEGPLEIDGTLELRPDRSYLLSGLVAAKPDAPRNLAAQLQLLGPPDPNGKRQFSLEGTL